VTNTFSYIPPVDGSTIAEGEVPSNAVNVNVTGAVAEYAISIRGICWYPVNPCPVNWVIQLLANSGVIPGTYGSSTQIVRITADQYGRTTSIQAVPVTPAWSSITGTPNTLSGYGIIDAVNLSQLGANTVGTTLGVATLDVNGKVLVSQLPPIAISNTYVVNNYADLANLTLAQVGAVGIVTANSSSYILANAPPSTLTNWIELLFPASVVSVNGQTGVVNLTAGDVGAAYNTTTIVAGNGLAGGGNLKSNVTLAIANTGVTPGTYGDTSNSAQITIGADGRVTSASNVAIDSTLSLIYAVALG